MSDDYYYSGLYAEEQAEGEAQAKEGAHRQGPWHVSGHTEGRYALVYDTDGFEVARVCYPNRNASGREEIVIVRDVETGEQREWIVRGEAMPYYTAQPGESATIRAQVAPGRWAEVPRRSEAQE